MASRYTEYTSEQLLERMKAEDGLAFEALYNRYWFKLFQSAHKRLRNREDAEEAVQNLFESLWKNRHKIHVSVSLDNYLFSAIRYIVLRILYKKMASGLNFSPPPQWDAVPDSSTEQTILANDLTRQIHRIVEDLPDRCKNVFQLSRYELKTHKEISDIMGISEKTVENHITKALRLIKSNLSHFFLFFL